ncbi:MAG: shikimate dehydrogenase [Acidimicrobiia bacterium]|nr:shikimate dehydrogenase [Acidimicrobiia bacterium]
MSRAPIRAVGGTTRVAGIIGDPVAHSRSPAIHNAAYAALDLDWVFVPFPVAAGGAAAALSGVRIMGIAGLNVTMPHKTDAAAACDVLSPTAATLGAVNTVVARDGLLAGDSTDGEGLVRSLRDEGIDPDGSKIVVLGAGGAGRAIAQSLGAHGARVTVAARRLDAAAAAAALAADGEAVDLALVGPAVAQADVVVNATPIGMQGEAPPFDPELLVGRQLVLETVYHPVETPLLAAARARSVPAANGLGMLVHQAALAFEAFTGVAAPLAVMRAAAA